MLDRTDTTQPLEQALELILAPLARLCVARGVPYATAEELLKQAFVDAARAMQRHGQPGHRDISRVSAATGLNRREVARLSQPRDAALGSRPAPATMLFTRWLGDPRWHAANGQPRVLPRQGPAPSFETLARSVTTDVHPRTLLEELLRLGLAVHDAASDTVSIAPEAFVPRGDAARLYGLLGQNVADHLAASVENVLGDGKQHFEQAVFAEPLSPASAQEVRRLVAAQWRALMAAIVPELEALIEADRGRDAGTPQRLRIGLYSYHEAAPPPAPAPDPAP